MATIIDKKLIAIMIGEFTNIAANSDHRDDLLKLIVEFGTVAAGMAERYSDAWVYNPDDVVFDKKPDGEPCFSGISLPNGRKATASEPVPESKKLSLVDNVPNGNDGSAEMSNCSNLEHGTPEIKWSEVKPLWTENKTFDMSKWYIARYCNPVSTMRGECGKKCIQTEVHFTNIKSGKFDTKDYEFASTDDLVAYLTPFIENGKQFIQPAQIEQTKPTKKTLPKDRELDPSKIKLSPKEQELREFLIANPDATRHDIAAKFDVTVASADTMKWSLRKKLELSRGLKK